MKVLETERLVLRRLTVEDSEFILEHKAQTILEIGTLVAIAVVTSDN